MKVFLGHVPLVFGEPQHGGRSLGGVVLERVRFFEKKSRFGKNDKNCQK